MTIENLRRKHKTILVDHAFRMYGITPNHDQSKQGWVDYLLSGGNFQAMLADLKDGRTLPSDNNLTARLPETLGSIALTGSPPEFHAGENYRIPVIVENKTNTIWQTSEANPIYLSYHWYFEKGDSCLFDGQRTALAAPVSHGEAHKLEMNVKTPGTFGNYVLELTMVMEGQFWFEECGFCTQRLAVQLNKNKLAPHAFRIYRDLVSAINKRAHGEG